jgi:hypothetical protein
LYAGDVFPFVALDTLDQDLGCCSFLCFSLFCFGGFGCLLGGVFGGTFLGID